MRALWGGAQDAFQGWWRTPTLGVGHWPERALGGQRLGEAWGECWSGGPKALLGEPGEGRHYESRAAHAACLPREDQAAGALPCHMGGGPEPLGQTGISDWLRALTCRENSSGRSLIY